MPTDQVQRPAIGWWIAILGGLGLLSLLALHSEAYAWWSSTVTAAISQAWLRIILVAAVVTHAAEATYAVRHARRSGMEHHAVGWCAQTFLLGFPSLRLLLRQTRTAP